MDGLERQNIVLHIKAAGANLQQIIKKPPF